MSNTIEINLKSFEFKKLYIDTQKQIYKKFKSKINNLKALITKKNKALENLKDLKYHENEILISLKKYSNFHPVFNIKNKISLKDRFNLIDFEIRKFVTLVKKVKKEEKIKINFLVERIINLILMRFPFLKVEIFGSLANKLNLPWSDIDIIIYYDDNIINMNREISILKDLYDYLKVI